MRYRQIFLTTLQGVGLVAGSLAFDTSRAKADVVNVECFSNGDGTTSCQRLSDGEWFDCARSVAGTSSCRSREVVPGLDAPITCTNNGAGIFTCTNSAGSTGKGQGSGTSVFDF